MWWLCQEKKKEPSTHRKKGRKMDTEDGGHSHHHHGGSRLANQRAFEDRIVRMLRKYVLFFASLPPLFFSCSQFQMSMRHWFFILSIGKRRRRGESRRSSNKRFWHCFRPRVPNCLRPRIVENYSLTMVLGSLRQTYPIYCPLHQGLVLEGRRARRSTKVFGVSLRIFEINKKKKQE